MYRVYVTPKACRLLVLLPTRFLFNESGRVCTRWPGIVRIDGCMNRSLAAKGRSKARYRYSGIFKCATSGSFKWSVPVSCRVRVVDVVHRYLVLLNVAAKRSYSNKVVVNRMPGDYHIFVVPGIEPKNCDVHFLDCRTERSNWLGTFVFRICLPGDPIVTKCELQEYGDDTLPTNHSYSYEGVAPKQGSAERDASANAILSSGLTLS